MVVKLQKQLDTDSPDARVQAGSTAAPYTFLERWVERGGLSWPLATVIAGLVLLLPLIVVAYLDGVFNRPFDARYWRITLLGPVVILYILATHPQFGRFRRIAINAFGPIVKLNADEFDDYIAKHLPLDQWREWLAFGFGAAAGEMLLRPWDVPEFDALIWSKVYRIILTGLMCGLISAVIYSSLATARFLSRLHRQPLDLNIFDLTPLEPIARRSLFYALVLIGGITLGLIFIPNQDARGLVINGIVILAAVLIFFLSMRDTHIVMRRAKERELKIVRQRLAAAHEKVLEQAAQSQAGSLADLSTNTNIWLNYEKRIKEAPEWPFTGTMLRNLLMSILIPIIIVTLQRVAVETFLKWVAGPSK